MRGRLTVPNPTGRVPRRDVYAQLAIWRFRFGVVVAMLFLAGVNAAVWIWGPPAAFNGVVDRWIGDAVPPVPTAASLSIAGPSFDNRGRALAFASVIQSAGAAAFLRALPDRGRVQVLVGPYVSSGEAESAQRMLAGRGLGDTHLLVDDSLRLVRHADLFAGWSSGSSLQPDIVAAAAPGILSLAVEMLDAPREVMLRRTAPSTIDLDISPVTVPMASRRWRGPEGSLLLSEIAVAPQAAALTLRLTVPPQVQSRLRMEGKRVYVDLAWPQIPWPADGGGRSGGGAAPLRPAGKARTAMRDEPIRLVIERFRQVQPFLLSAVDSPEPAVLAAVAKTLEELERSLVESGVNERERRPLRTALEAAIVAAAAGFSGDRAVAAREAIGRFEAAAKGIADVAGEPPAQ